MRVDERQVERSLAALRAEAAGERRDARPRPRAVPSGLVERLAAAPDLRHDLIQRARAQLDDGEPPTPAALAGHVVGRLVCERLR